MKINGFTIRSSVRRIETKIGFVKERIQYASDGTDVEALMKEFEDLERDLAKLQGFQSFYNLNVLVSSGAEDEKVSLAEAVKRIGGVERLSMQWRKFQGDDSKVNSSVIAKQAVRLSSELSDLRSKMSAANQTELEIPELEERLVK